MDTTRIIKVLDAQSGRFTEQELEALKIEVRESDVPYPRDSYGKMTVNHEKVVGLQEAPGVMSTANFPDLLRAGLKFDAFTNYAETPSVHGQFVQEVNSDKQQEEYIKDANIGLLPIVTEGAPYPEAAVPMGDGVIVKNYKRGMIVSVTEEMQKFDQIGKVRQLGELMGRAGRLSEDQDVMVALTDTANYTRTNTAGDNDETTGSGANYQAVTFSPTGLITAFNILRTMKDRTSGAYLNVMPNTLVVTPKLWWAVRQLIGSPELWGQGDADATVVYGQGTKNSFFNVVSTIIVSPMFGSSYQWALMERYRGMKFQRVEPLQILIEAKNATSSEYFERDVIRYRVRNWYGAGFVDDRFNFYSTSTTAPTIN